MHRLRHARVLWVFSLYWASCSLEHLCSSQSAQSAQCAQASLVGRSSALRGISSGSSSTSTYSLRLESAQARSNKCDDPLDPFADLCQDFGNMVKVVQLLVSTCSSSRSPRPRLVLKIGHRIVLRARTANQLFQEVGLGSERATYNRYKHIVFEHLVLDILALLILLGNIFRRRHLGQSDVDLNISHRFHRVKSN